jgi:hypothetical protein
LEEDLEAEILLLLELLVNEGDSMKRVLVSLVLIATCLTSSKAQTTHYETNWYCDGPNFQTAANCWTEVDSWTD